MYLKSFLTTLFTVLFLAGSLSAQDMNLTLQGTPQMKIDGDSNVRSWDADAKEVKASLTLTGVENVSLDALTADAFKEMKISVKVDQIDSGTRGLTRNIHNYLKADSHPEITFTLKSIEEIEKQNDSAKITAIGVINAAGKDHEVTMNVTARMNNNGTINFSGEQDLLMTSFDIDPPTAVMGTVRARDEFKVIYSVDFGR
jgi:hypothetical protein